MLDKITSDLKKAMLGGDKFRTETLKLLKSSLSYAKIAQGSELSAEQEIAVVKKELKKRQESIALYEQAGRAESAEKERAEMMILQEFAPVSLSGDDLINAFQKFMAQNSDLLAAGNFGAIIKEASGTLGDVDKQQLASLIKEALTK